GAGRAWEGRRSTCDQLVTLHTPKGTEMPEQQTDWTIIPCPARFVDRASGSTLMEVTATEDGARVIVFGEADRQVELSTLETASVRVRGGAEKQASRIELLAGIVHASADVETPMGALCTVYARNDHAEVNASADGCRSKLVAEPTAAELLLEAEDAQDSRKQGRLEASVFPTWSGLSLIGPGA